jgi:CubicO group peptidase (beta-lactamase class C family)
MDTINGFVAPGFERVAEEFATNFRERGEVGAAFAASLRGVPVVDLWGGVADRRTERAWSRDTLQLIFSGTKGLVAASMLVLVDRGLLDPGAPVCAYWPEFAAEGKDTITVAEAMSHRARLPSLTQPTRVHDLLDDERMAAVLAQQRPSDDPRAAAAYHALTFGWICGELVRRVTGRSVGRFFAEELAGPLGLDAWIGLPQDLEHRVSHITYGSNWEPAAAGYEPSVVQSDPLLATVLDNPAVFPDGNLYWNDPAFHAAEIPAINAIATARALARLYDCLAAGGTIGNVTILEAATVATARRELVRFRDPFFGEPMAYGFGFQLQTELHRFGEPADAFGHGGAGGSMHGAWPGLGVGFSYIMNELRHEPVVEPRSVRLLAALHQAVTA